MNTLRLSPWIVLPLTLGRMLVAQEPPVTQLLLKDYRPRSIYNVPVTRMEKARFPVIDMHSHNYAETDQEIAAWVRTMDELGITKTIVLSGDHGKEFDAVLARYKKFPGRFSVWCGFDYAGCDQPGYGPAAVVELERCFKAGAEGVGEIIDKGQGLFPTVPLAQPMHFDDSRMDPLLEQCGRLGLPINIHVAEPKWMFEPMDKHNDGLMNAYKWRRDNQTNGLSHAELIVTLERAVKKHPRTVFVACHYANSCYDLTQLGELFDKYPNLYADISARYVETAAIPRHVAKFYQRYQDRLVYGTDMGFRKQMFLTTFRILETEDEHFYDWDISFYHWPLHGFGLDNKILKKVYSENARKILERRK